MSFIYFKDYRRIGSEILEDKYEFGDFMVTNEEVREGNNYYRKITFIHKVELTDSNVDLTKHYGFIKAVRCFFVIRVTIGSIFLSI